MALKDNLQKLVNSGVITDFVLDNVSIDGVVGQESDSRNTERLTLKFPTGEELVLNTFCSGCQENTCFI